MIAVDTKFELERKELEWLLSPGVMGRSNNSARVLQFICDKYFKDEADQLCKVETTSSAGVEVAIAV